VLIFTLYAKATRLIRPIIGKRRKIKRCRLGQIWEWCLPKVQERKIRDAGKRESGVVNEIERSEKEMIWTREWHFCCSFGGKNLGKLANFAKRYREKFHKLASSSINQN
jgi:hypothetical protein